MNKKYINSETFEIEKNIFEVDEDIANTISILNKKGYKTSYCCSGHIKDPRLYEKYYISNDNDWGSDIPNSYIIDKTNDGYYLLKPYTETHIYIKFCNEYHFLNLPIGFILEKDNTLYKEISYYNESQKKSSNEIDKEIKESNKQLVEWAKTLPSKK